MKKRDLTGRKAPPPKAYEGIIRKCPHCGDDMYYRRTACSKEVCQSKQRQEILTYEEMVATRRLSGSVAMSVGGTKVVLTPWMDGGIKLEVWDNERKDHVAVFLAPSEENEVCCWLMSRQENRELPAKRRFLRQEEA